MKLSARSLSACEYCTVILCWTPWILCVLYHHHVLVNIVFLLVLCMCLVMTCAGTWRHVACHLACNVSTLLIRCTLMLMLCV